jgi:hypothetical protein
MSLHNMQLAILLESEPLPIRGELQVARIA